MQIPHPLYPNFTIYYLIKQHDTLFSPCLVDNSESNVQCLKTLTYAPILMAK